MNVLLINGSPHRGGCTFTALTEVARVLEEEGINTEIFHIGNEPIKGCLACGQCWALGKCISEDICNDISAKAYAADGLIVGSPVHYAQPAGPLVTLMHRLSYASNGRLRGKPGAAVTVARRGGTTATLDALNKYFPILGMPLVPSQYWNMVHGAKPDDLFMDLEGLQTMRLLGRNMAWLLKLIKSGEEHGIVMPELEPRVWTNFIR